MERPYADHTGRATLPMGVKDRRKTEEKKKKWAVPRAAVAYGRQLKRVSDYTFK